MDKGPVLTYEGNQNSHSLIGLGVDASESLLASGVSSTLTRFNLNFETGYTSVHYLGILNKHLPCYNASTWLAYA